MAHHRSSAPTCAVRTGRAARVCVHDLPYTSGPICGPKIPMWKGAAVAVVFTAPIWLPSVVRAFRKPSQ